MNRKEHSQSFNHFDQQIKDAMARIGQQQMMIETLESQKMDFIKAVKERDKLITQMQAEA